MLRIDCDIRINKKKHDKQKLLELKCSADDIEAFIGVSSSYQISLFCRLVYAHLQSSLKLNKNRVISISYASVGSRKTVLRLEAQCRKHKTLVN